MNEPLVKFLIIGAQGLIGEALGMELESQYPWDGSFYARSHPRYHFCDITQQHSINDLLDATAPTHVIHSANLGGGVGFCEKNPDLAKKIHFEGTKNVGEACHRRGAKFIYLSTECVFDGSKENYQENDKYSPLNVYGQCKAQSETWIRENLSKFNIIRTMSVFGWQPKTQSPNAVMSMYFAIRDKRLLKVPTFRWSSPTYVKDLAKAIVELSLSSEDGIFHISGLTYLSRYDWLQRTCRSLGWDCSYVVSQQNPDLEEVPYPHKIRLDMTKFQERFKTRLHTFEEALVLLKQDILSSKA